MRAQQQCYGDRIVLERSGMPVCDGGAIDTRSLHTAQLQQTPFLNYAAVATTGRPGPYGGSWGAQVDLESSMRSVCEHNQRERCEPRTLVLPLSLHPFVDMVCEQPMGDYREPCLNTRMMHHDNGGCDTTKVFYV